MMKRQLNKGILVCLIFCGLLSACAEMKEAGTTIGHTARDVGKDIGHGTVKAVKAVGKGVKRVVGEANKDAKEVKEEESEPED